VNLDDLLEALAGAPNLPGAVCVGEHEIFDETEDPGIIDLAIRACHHCPALLACRSWYESLPPTKRPPGVTAGQLNHPKKPGKAA
jgi:hypothetical protein